MRPPPVERSFPASQVRLTYFEWGDSGASPILLVHATGFHARCWDRTVAALPDGYRVIALDMRGHGLSEKHGPYQWSTMAGDLEEFVAGLGLDDAIGVGHSMGGYCVTYAAARLPGAFSRLLLVDPVILAPEAYGDARFPGYQTAEDHPVARRRNHWASWQAMYESFRDREPFSLWRPDVLEDYCRYGVLPDAAGDGFELACPPLVEASIYLGSSATDIHALIHTVEVPVDVLRAQSRDAAEGPAIDFSKSPTWTRLAEEFVNGRDVYLPELSHFIPMQDPPLVARFIVNPSAVV